jgi:hypothetical protein
MVIICFEEFRGKEPSSTVFGNISKCYKYENQYGGSSESKQITENSPTKSPCYTTLGHRFKKYK